MNLPEQLLQVQAFNQVDFEARMAKPLAEQSSAHAVGRSAPAPKRTRHEMGKTHSAPTVIVKPPRRLGSTASHSLGSASRPNLSEPMCQNVLQTLMPAALAAEDVISTPGSDASKPSQKVHILRTAPLSLMSRDVLSACPCAWLWMSGQLAPHNALAIFKKARYSYVCCCRQMLEALLATLEEARRAWTLKVKSCVFSVWQPSQCHFTTIVSSRMLDAHYSGCMLVFSCSTVCYVCLTGRMAYLLAKIEGLKQEIEDMKEGRIDADLEARHLQWRIERRHATLAYRKSMLRILIKQAILEV